MRTVVPLSVSAIMLCIAFVHCCCLFGTGLAADSSPFSSASQELPWYEALLAVKYLPEALVGILLIAYCSNIFLGKKANDSIALAFESTFCLEGGLLDRNFSQVGPRLSGEPDVMLRESMNKYSVYATGRRFCQSFEAILDLKHRQDVFFLTTYLVSPQDDILDIEIPMNENDMEPMCLFIAAPRLAKRMIKNLPDVDNFTAPVDTNKHLPNFTTSLAVWAEFPGLFCDLMPERVMELLFSRSAFREASKCFRHLHFSTDNPEGSPRNSLKFSFVIPPVEQMEDLTKCLTAVFNFIDVSWLMCILLDNSLGSPCTSSAYLPSGTVSASRIRSTCVNPPACTCFWFVLLALRVYTKSINASAHCRHYSLLSCICDLTCNALFHHVCGVQTCLNPHCRLLAAIS